MNHRAPAGKKRPARAFVYRGGVQLGGTSLTCDAVTSASDLVFLSHAQAVDAPGTRPFRLRSRGRQQLLTTDATLALLGRAGERIRRYALPAIFGRPFLLGDVRLELFPSGYLPGSASLLCEGGTRPTVYAGSVRRERPGFGATAAEVRRADAVCLDGTFGSPRFVFPPAEEALAQVRQVVERAIAAKRTPVLLVPPFGTALEIADALNKAGIAVRGHRSVMAAAAAFGAAGVETPEIKRFAGRMAAGEALLWPPEGRQAALLRALPAPLFAFVSGFSLDPEIAARIQVEVSIGLAAQSGYSDLLAYVEATGAREVAVHRGFAEELAIDLRRRGFDAYAIGPPRQMELFRG